MGTPYRGAIKALSVLADGPMPKLGRFGDQLHPTVLSFPSGSSAATQLRMCRTGRWRPRLLSDQTDSALPNAARRNSPALFYRELEDAESTDSETAARRHAIVGTLQPTSAFRPPC